MMAKMWYLLLIFLCSSSVIFACFWQRTIVENIILESSKHTNYWLMFWNLLFCLDVVENITVYKDCMLQNKSHLFLMYRSVYALVASYWSFIFNFDLQTYKFLIMIMNWQSMVLYIQRYLYFGLSGANIYWCSVQDLLH